MKSLKNRVVEKKFKLDSPGLALSKNCKHALVLMSENCSVLQVLSRQRSAVILFEHLFDVSNKLGS